MADTTEEPTTQEKAPSIDTGQYAVYDHDLGQFVSGVSSKRDADAARKNLSGHNGVITDGHKLETRKVG